MTETIELKGVVEKAMDLIIDNQAETALTTLWCLHRALRGINFTIDMPGEQPAIEAPKPADEVRYHLEQQRERDRIRKQRDRERAKENYWKEKHEMAEKLDRQLPPMKPINGRVAPVKTAEITCPLCAAKPGQPCFGMTNPGRHAKVDTSRTIGTLHKKRTAKAQEMTAKRQADAERRLIEGMNIPVDEGFEIRVVS